MKYAEICAVRHGQTDWNKLGILQGWIDVTINERGRHQALDMAQAYAQHRFSAIWSSPLVRARETAEIITRQIGLGIPNIHEGLKERHFGAIQGIPKDELAELNPSQLEQILRRNPAAHFVGGESMDEFADRVLQGFQDIGVRHAGQRVLVITHGWVLDVVTRQVSGKPRNYVLPEKPKNGECLWVNVDSMGNLSTSNHMSSTVGSMRR